MRQLVNNGQTGSQEIVFMLGAANRDACQFKDPDRLDLKRGNNPHLAFGAGVLISPSEISSRGSKAEWPS